MEPLLKNRILQGKVYKRGDFDFTAKVKGTDCTRTFFSSSKSMAKINAENFYKTQGVYIIVWED